MSRSLSGRRLRQARRDFARPGADAGSQAQHRERRQFVGGQRIGCHVDPYRADEIREDRTARKRARQKAGAR